MTRYAYSLHERATLAVLATDDSGQRELLTLFETLARSPGHQTSERVVDETGRFNEVTYSEHYRVVYWADHAVKEVRIMDVRHY